MIEPTDATRFSSLFSGLHDAYGTGKGQWIKRAPAQHVWEDHLRGKGPGIGIAPLRPDSKVLFAAIDLDEPDFDAAEEMQLYIPGQSFIERTRSGNVHVWVFFSEPIEAWVPMGILKAAIEAAGKKHVEVFPKNWDFSRVKLGNYINLPFHGDKRPVLVRAEPGTMPGPRGLGPCSLSYFLDAAERTKNRPSDWRTKADYLMIGDPRQRESTGPAFGQQPRLHMCAEYILSGEAGPIPTGHRQNVYFAVAKQLSNWSECDSEEALDMLRSLNDYQPAGDRVPDAELIRILGNAERGEYKSTGCDDPVVLPFTHPDCPIAHPRS